jgi:hypothetical protein
LGKLPLLLLISHGGNWSVLTDDVLLNGRPNSEPLVLLNLANHSVKGFGGGEKVGPKLAGFNALRVFGRSNFHPETVIRPHLLGTYS